MDDRPEPVTRLGPNSGGRLPGDGNVRVYPWEWGSDDTHRPGLPWIGIFLLVFGGLLLLQQAFPSSRRSARSSSSRSDWRSSSSGRSTAAPARCTPARSSPRWRCPGLLNAAGVDANGLTTFSLGVAFLFIAMVRLATGGGVGWQLWFGGLLAVIGGARSPTRRWVATSSPCCSSVSGSC